MVTIYANDLLHNLFDPGLDITYSLESGHEQIKKVCLLRHKFEILFPLTA